MSSRKLSDKEFDRYARNVLKKPENVPFDEAAWSAMEQKMLAQGGSASMFHLKWIIPSAIIILSLTSYFGYQYFTNPNENTDELSKTGINQNLDTEQLLVEEKTKETRDTSTLAAGESLPEASLQSKAQQSKAINQSSSSAIPSQASTSLNKASSTT
ncbi:MAG: hypothetical protein AAFY41_19580, partial [Bacteroidota bacterium]